MDGQETMIVMEESDIESAYRNLERLCEKLPDMQSMNDRLVRSYQAARVLELERKAEIARELFEEACGRESDARASFGKACQEKDETEIERSRCELLYTGSLSGFRIGPLKYAEDTLSRALLENDFNGVEAARESRLSEVDSRNLQAELDLYRGQYADALALCERLESEGKPSVSAKDRSVSNDEPIGEWKSDCGASVMRVIGKSYQNDYNCDLEVQELAQEGRIS